MAASAQADALQRKIFSRYVNQKLSTSRGIAVDDVVEQGKTGVLLFNLIEVLSEVSFTEKYNQAPKLRVHSLDNCNRALKFAKDQGVSMKVFPQAENLVDGDEKAVLGLIWSIILKFMKFGDADESLNAKDALLMWVQNKTAGYEGVDVKDFKSSIKDGVALGAVIHRHRPAMIDMSTLTPGAANAVANWKIVQAAAESYFGLEQYITPEEILKLDENSMVIYVSDYYYGIAEQRKVDLAARRLTKLIDYTKVNDDLRQQYQDRAHSFTTRVAKVREVLNDRTIDNTMEGAKRRIAEFYEYKTTDKSAVLADQLNIEGLYNSLSMRLANGKRPAYQPPAGTDLLAMNATVAELEKTEQERKTALHAELNRQIKLLDFDRQHTEQSAKLSAYQAETQAYLETKEVSHSVGAAEYQVRRLDASDEERHNVYQSTFAKLKDLGAYLESEHYERTGEVKGREAALQASFDNLEAASNAKRPVLLDDLAREKFREEIRLKNEQHVSDFNHLLAWVAESEAYLQKKEHVDSVADANRHQGLLQAYVASKDAQTKNTVSALKALGSHIVSARYQGISTYQFGDAPDPAGPATVADRESQVDAKWVLLDQLHADKKSILDDDLARETFRRGLALRNQQHIKQFDQISAWAAASAAYLRTKEVVDSVSEAQTALAILSAYADDKVTQTSSSVAHLKNVGQEILNAKYEGPHSSYTFGSAATDAAHPADIHQREQKVDELWQELDGLHADKKAVLDDDLARETFREGLQVQNSIHSNAFDSLKAYAAEGKQYLEVREHIDDIPKANTAISTLTGFREGKTQKSSTAVASFKQLGQQIVSAKYETGHSSYTFGSAASDKVHPSDLAQREQEVDQLFAQLDELAAAKDGWLASELDREQKKEQKRVEFANQASAFSRFTIERANEAQATHFGFTLAEVEEFAAKLDASDVSINASAQQSLDSAVATFQAGAELGVKDNAYTKASPDSLQAEADKLKAELGERRKRYQAELERQRYLDGLCRDFATVADPFAANIVASKNEISNSQAELVDQLAFVNNRIAQAHGADQQGLQAIQAAQQKLDDEGVTNNIHTTQTAKDIQVQHQQFIVFLERKKTMLEEAIEQAKLRGLTPAQFQEIESNFKQFDADADGVINARELKACLYSLGEEKGPKQVAEILEKHGNGKNAIEYPQFREFLINLFGDADTKDEILHGFQLINRRTDGITTQERMALVLPENDVNYITTTAPASGEGYDAVAWTESVFAR